MKDKDQKQTSRRSKKAKTAEQAALLPENVTSMDAFRKAREERVRKAVSAQGDRTEPSDDETPPDQDATRR